MQKKSPILKQYCHQCMKQEDEYGFSERQRFVRANRKPTLQQAEDFLASGEYKLKERCLYVQLRTFGNQCNLDCYMCHPRNSSTKSKQNKQFNYEQFIGFDPDNYDPKMDNYDPYLEKILELAPYISNWRIEGGEPLIMRNQYNFLDRIIESGHSKYINLELNTNATTLKQGKHRILDYFKRFNEVHINLSIDGIGQHGDYIRRRSKWEEIVENVNTLKTVKNVHMEITCSLSLLSVIHHDQVKKWGKENNFVVKRHVVDYPRELHPKNLPMKVKQLVAKRNPGDEVLLNAIKGKGNEKHFKNAIKYLELMDRSYNFSMELYDLYPELDKNFYRGYYEEY